jgi:anti-sigma B factor antagonist
VNGQEARPVITVAAPKSFDVYSSAAAREEFIAAIERRCAGLVIADLEGVEFMDNTGIGVLVGALRRAQAHEARFGIVCTQEHVLRLFRVAGLAKVFDIRGSAEEFSNEGRSA